MKTSLSTTAGRNTVLSLNSSYSAES